MPNADGSVVISFDANVSDAEKAISELKKEIESAEEKLKSAGENKELAESINDAKEKAGELLKTLVDWGSVHRYTEQVAKDMEEMAKAAEAAAQGSTAQNEMQRELENSKAAIEALEKRGMWFGDAEYDEAIKKQAELTANINLYKKELLTPPKPENPFGLDTISGKLREAEIALQRLSNAGKGFGDQEFDKQARQVAELREEYKAYQAEVTKTTAQRQKEAAIQEALEARLAAQKQKEEAAEAARQARLAAQRQKESEAMIAQEAKAAAQRSREEDIARESARLRELADNATIANQHIVSLRQELAALTVMKADYDKAGSGLGTEQYDRIVTRISEINGELNQYKRGLLESGDNAREAAEGVDEMANAGRKAGGMFDKLGKRIWNLAKRVFVFSMITAALRGMRTWLGNVIKSNDEASAAIARLKGALLTLIQPLVGVLIPAFTKLVDLLAKLTATAAKIVSSLFGTTVDESAEAAENLYEEQNALEKTGEAAEEAQKSLAGFDEINQLSGQEDQKKEEDPTQGATPPDFASVINSQLDALAELFTGVALLVIGAILTFSGANVPLGIALMALGAAFIEDAVTTNWQTVSQLLQGPLGTVFIILSAALLVIGAILTFAGILPLGIALMALGAAGLAASVALNWSAISDVLQDPIGVLFAVLSAALLVIGAILLFSGVNIPLGLALMAIGALGLAAVVAANWGSIAEILRGPIGIAISALSAAALVIGAVLLFSGVNIPLGLGLIVVGAVGLAATVAANWNSIQGYIAGPVGAIMGILSGVLLVLGVMLAFSGASIPMGLGLMIIGAVGLATAYAANWDTIQNALEGPVGTIMALLSGVILVVGAVLAFSGVALPIGLGLMVIGAIGLGTAIAANWDTITSALGGPINAITALVSGALLVLGVILLFTGAGVPLGLGLIAMGAAGLATAIAPNWDFVLEKLQGAWKNVQEWWKSSVSKFTSPEWWMDLGKSMIDGLLQGLAGIFTGLKDWAGKVWDTITGAFSSENAKASVSSGAGGGSTRTVRAINYNAIPPISNFKIPALAKGAVIPPNREFLAVLGDQKNGTNIEAPTEEIENAVFRAVQRAGTNGQVQVNVTFNGSLAQLARILQPEITAETRRRGPSLVTGGA